MPDVIHGFELVREQDVPEINSKARIFRHVKTGAELLSMTNDDENKVFAITFATPPPDDTGVAHILEHSVLNGSQKYPVKEPFIHMIKGSLASFINALTFSDKTMYPVASQNLQDFYNLIDVYLDAVFFPQISPEILQQEGWHFELDSPDDELAYRGVVYNEMKGAYSSADRLMGVAQQKSLYPDTAYGNDSGGDPTVMPNLTYEQFKGFHETYYHPSNARIYMYGDDDETERLRLLDAYLCQFEAIDVDSSIDLQPQFDEPRRVTQPYDAGEEDEPKSMVAVSWLLPEPNDVELMYGFNILEHALLGTQAAPLKKALLESGLGENTTGGLDDGMRQMNFSTGLRGVQPDDVDKVEPFILETLEKLANEGIDRGQIEASLNTVEFQLREFNTGGIPRGLLMGIRSMSTWLYGGDPVAPLAFEEPLETIKARVTNGENYFESLIREYLLANQHRTTVVMEPDKEFAVRLESAEKERLQQAREQMTEEDVQRVIEDTEKLRTLQTQPDDPEDLARLPMLRLADIEREIRTIPLEEIDVDGTPILYHDLPTNGVFYLDIGFNLKALPQAYLPYLAIFNRVLLQMGTQVEDYVTFTQRIGRKTGGINMGTLLAERYADDDTEMWSFLHGKSTVDQVDDMLAILRDVLLMPNFNDRERFRQIVLSEKAKMEAALAPAGHQFVGSRLGAHFTRSGWLGEQLGGVSYLFYLRELADKIDTDWNSIQEHLEGLRAHLFNRDVMIANVTVDGDSWSKTADSLKDFINGLPAESTTPGPWNPDMFASGEGLSIPAQVNYVGKGANLYDLGYTYHGSAAVIMNYLRTDYLWNRIRVQGGAYGAFSRFDMNSGVLRFGSYRDPNLLETLDVYDGAADHLRNLELSQDELEKMIIGVIGDLDRYQLPDAKGYSSMVRHLVGYSDDERQRVRDEVLGTTQADINRFGDVLKQVAEQGRVVVMGARESLQKALDERPGLYEVVKVL